MVIRLVYIAIIFGLFGCQKPQLVTPITGATDIRYCEIFTRSDAPGKKLVRVSGLFTDAFECVRLRDPSCKGETWVWISDKTQSHTEPKVFRRFKSWSYGEKEIKVTFIGVLEGPRPLIKNTNMFGFGHMGVFPAQLTVLAVEKVGD